MIRFNQPKQPVRTQRAIPESLRYTAHDVERQSGESDVDFSAYHVLRMELTAGGGAVARLKKPLQTVFQNARVCFMTIDKRSAYAVVCHGAADMHTACMALEEAFTSFTGQSVNIGVSMQGSGEVYLPIAFRQADAALEKAFFQPEATVYLFYAETCTIAEHDRELTEYLRRFGDVVHGGETERCMALLEDFFRGQQSELHPHQIRVEGQRLLQACLEELERVGVPADVVNRVSARGADLAESQTFTQYSQVLRSLMTDSCHAVAQRLQSGGNAVLDARNYIEQNFHRAISLGEVASAIGVNPGYLSRTFKSKTGANLVDTINRKKVAAAKEALGLGRLKISEIAVSVGIEDTAYFSHLFRKYTGMSPRAYQKLQLHGEEK